MPARRAILHLATSATGATEMQSPKRGTVTEHQQRPGAAVVAWMRLQYVLIALWVGGIAVLAVAGANFLIIAMAGVLSGLGIGFVVDPRRSWWSPDIGELMRDPARMKQYRVRMTVALIAILVLVPLIVTIVRSAVVDSL
jgi:hypothetical protein